MSVIGRSDESTKFESADNAGMNTKKDSMNHTGKHSMMRHMLLCGLGMLATLVIAAALGVNVAPLFCVAMMVAMVWMMAAPAVGKLRHRTR
jgi:Flp pilus assembly protein TadB